MKEDWTECIDREEDYVEKGYLTLVINGVTLD